MESLATHRKEGLKDLQLNALLEVTQAINNNLPEKSLYKIYNFTLRSNLKISGMALYVRDEDWLFKTGFGTQTHYQEHTLSPTFLACEDLDPCLEKAGEPYVSDFDRVMTVTHKEKKLAYVFLKGLDISDEAELSTLNFIRALTNIIIVAIENKKFARRQLQQEMLQKELDIAKNVQQLLIPTELPFNEHLKVISFYQPHHVVGGDYYDFFRIDKEKFLVCIADVSGKGFPAAILMSNFQASLRTLIRQTNDIKDIVEELNYQILQNAHGEHFITFFLAIYDEKEQTLQYVNAGHNPPFLLKDGKWIRLEVGTTVLGVFSPLPFLNYETIGELDKFTLFAFTDGLIETQNSRDQELGSDALDHLFKKQNNTSIDQLKEKVIDLLDHHRGDNAYFDDITFIGVQVI